MIAKLLVTIGVLAYGVLVPVLEVNASHLFNPAWPAHARLHEAWQLLTNCALGAYCLWRAWGRGDVRVPSQIALLVTGGFLGAYALRARYGGSMVLTDGSEKVVSGLNGGVVVFGLVAVLSLTALLLDRRARAQA